jgi:ATP-dependent DNA ligase
MKPKIAAERYDPTGNKATRLHQGLRQHAWTEFSGKLDQRSYKNRLFSNISLLLVEGKDLRNEPLSVRRQLLAGVLKKAPANIRFSQELLGSKEELLRVAQEFGLEGLVAKRKNSLYESGRRTGAWAKVKKGEFHGASLDRVITFYLAKG